jgi:hypothetical protein
VASHLIFLAGLAAFVVFPGFALLRLSGFRGDRPESLALAGALGTGAAAVVYKAVSAAGHPRLIFLWAAAALAYLGAGLLRGRPAPAPPVPRSARAGIALAAMAVLVLAVLGMDNYRNGLPRPDGSLTVHMHYYDGFVRNAVVREVAHSVPPQLPFAAGTPLNYHYGMDLLTAMFHTTLGLDVLNLSHRDLITFFFGLLLLSSYVFLRDFFTKAAAVWGTFLVLFGSGGLYFAASLLLGVPQGGNIFYSFYFFDLLAVNSFLPGLALLFAGFFCLGRYTALGRRSDLALAAALLAVSSEFKIFLIWPVLAALLASGAAAWLKFRDRSLLKAFGLTAALFLPLLGFALLRGGDIPFRFGLGFVDWVGRALANLKLAGLADAWNGVLYESRLTFGGVLASLLGLVVFVLGSWGLSAAALPVVLRRAFAFDRSRIRQAFLAWLWGGSTATFFLFNLRLDRLPRNILNIYVYYLGVVILAVFWGDLVVRALARRKPWQRAAAFLLVAALCVPNGVRFLRDKVRVPDRRDFSAAFLRTADWLERNSRPEDVVLHPLDMTYLCYFAGRRVVLDASAHSYLEFHLPVREIRRRKGDIERFFRAPAESGDVLSAYGVRYLWVPVGTVLPSESRPGPAGERAYGLERAFENEAFALWRVR